MKIKGFTLAEVLIVLTILGVIAALTMPALNTNIQKQQAGPALMRAISTLETANALVANEREFYNFAESCRNYLNDCFEPFVKEKIGAASFNERIEYENLGNPGMALETFSNGYVTKNGFVYYIPSVDLNDSGIMRIFVDINGNKRPNVIGKDLFYLTLIAENEGSHLYADSSDALLELPQAQSDESWRNACNERQVSDGRTCAGSIVDNGGRVIYPW